MKIICVGRNYSEHAKELNNPLNSEPVIFLKPESARLVQRQPFFIPDGLGQIHYEAEIVVKINRLGKNITEKFANRYFDEITLGIDFTAREKQAELKSKGLPWELAKSFDGAAVTGNFIPLSAAGDIGNIGFSLLKNGQTVQTGNTGDMIYSVPYIVSFVSRFFTLKKGDLIFTGTPAGVGPVAADDVLEGRIGDQKLFTVKVK